MDEEAQPPDLHNFKVEYGGKLASTKVNRIEDVKERVLSTVRDNETACDMTVTLFMAACSSYKCNSLLRPFPPQFLHGEEKDFSRLTEFVEKVPCLSDLHTAHLDEEVWELLDWMLCNPRKQFSLTTVPKTSLSKKVQELEELANQVVPTQKPDYVFDVSFSELVNSSFDERHRNCDESRMLLHGYHGSRLENWHSILYNGLNGIQSKTSLYGEGTYLSEELSLCMHYSPFGKGWQNSLLGKKISCIAFCEIINHPAVRCCVEGDTVSARKRSLAQNSEGGRVPEKYFVVTNDELLRVKSLLVYVDNAPTCRVKKVQPSWAWEHRFLLSMIGYLLCLIAIGVANSPFARKFMRKWTHHY